VTFAAHDRPPGCQSEFFHARQRYVTAIAAQHSRPLSPIRVHRTVRARVCVCVNGRDRIGLAVLTLLEKGELQKLHNTWWYGKGECVADDSKVYFIIYLKH